MSPDERLLSVAEIARRLGVPESTVHYWKNRFAQHLPSTGSGRQKRFRVEAVDVFRVIAEMFSLGHSAQDVMETLSKRFPLTASVDGEAFAAGIDAPFTQPRTPRESDNGLCSAAVADTALRLAAGIAKEIGQEIAKHVGQSLRQHLNSAPALEGPDGQPQQLALGSEELDAIRAAVDNSCTRIDAHADEVARMATENTELKAKLSVLESELIRLRKDRRELEKYLLDKIKSVTT